MYRNAQELNAFRRKITRIIAQHQGGSINGQLLDDLDEEYRKIKDGCPDNHVPLDDDYFIARHRLSPEFCNENGAPWMSWLEAQIVRLKNFLRPIWYYCVLWCVLIALVLVMPLGEIRNATKGDPIHPDAQKPQVK